MNISVENLSMSTLTKKDKGEQKPRQKKEEREKQLYEPLKEYLFNKLGVDAFIIEAAKSSRFRAGTNKWKHPDLVGYEITKRNFNPLTQQLYLTLNEKKKFVRIWLFEVKETLKFKDLTVFYSQANTNSSWANFGYLCVGEIEDRDETIEQLQRLRKSHNIGVIEINKKKPLESKILIDAALKEEINWDECSHLEQNGDFRKFLQAAIDASNKEEFL